MDETATSLGEWSPRGLRAAAHTAPGPGLPSEGAFTDRRLKSNRPRGRARGPLRPSAQGSAPAAPRFAPLRAGPADTTLRPGNSSPSWEHPRTAWLSTRSDVSHRCHPRHPMETGTFPSRNLENRWEPHFTLLSLPVLSEVPLSPIIIRGRLRWRGSDGRQSGRRGTGK